MKRTKRAKFRHARPVVVVPPPLKQIGVPNPKAAPLPDNIDIAETEPWSPAWMEKIRRRAANSPDRSIM